MAISAPKDRLAAAQLKALTREFAQLVKKTDVGAVLAEVAAEDPLGEAVPKRKRIAAALIATDDRERDGAWVKRLMAALERYDQERHRQVVERQAEHVVDARHHPDRGRPDPR